VFDVWVGISSQLGQDGLDLGCHHTARHTASMKDGTRLVAKLNKTMTTPDNNNNDDNELT
jgi:transcriptional antiterminator Rof (Rho-off)